MNTLGAAKQASLEISRELPMDRTCPSTEDIEEQCRRIGLAGLYLADLTPSAGPSFSRSGHPNLSIAEIKPVNLQNTPPLSQESNLQVAVCNNSVPFSPMSLSASTTSFLPRIVCSTWETAEVPHNRLILNHFRRYVHHITSDVNALRSRSTSSRLSVFPLPPSNHHRNTIRIRRNRRSHNWRLLRHASLQPHSRRSRTLLRTQSRHRSSVSSFKNSSSYEVDILKSSPNLSDAEPNEPSVESSKVTEQVPLPNYSELRSICSSSGVEEIHPLPSLLSLPSNADVSAASKVNFGTVRLRKHASSPAGRRFPSRRRNAVYLASRGSPCRCSNGNGGDEVVPIPSTSHPVPPPFSSTSRNKGVRISNKNKLLPQVPYLCLPAFPPDLNSLDHAYSSPIRHELLPRPEIGRIRTEESEISTRSSRISRPTVAKISKAPTPIPSDRTLSLELQSESITEGFHQSASSASIYDLIKGRFPTSGSDLRRSVSLSSMHSDAFCAKKMSIALEDNGESLPPGHTVSLQIKTSSAPEDIYEGKPTWTEMLVTLVLTALVSIFGGLLLSSGAFHGFSLSLLCCVIAGCHYSLIKSVQPDPASPRHGFNRLIIYSRSLVFCLLGFLFALTLILIPSAHNNADSDVCPANFNIVRRRSSTFWFSGEGVTTQLPSLTLYGWNLEALWILCLAKDLSGYLILTFPLICLFGLVPQANTLVANVLEQIDIHVFGSSGSVNLISGVVSVFRSCLVLTLGFGFCYAAVLNNNPQDVFFSAFWGLYLPLCYLLSRTPNNVGIMRHIFTHISSLDKTETTDSRYHHILQRISLCLQKLLISPISLNTSRQQKDTSNTKAKNSPGSSFSPKLENDVVDNATFSFSSSRLVGTRQSQPSVWSNLNGVGEANPVAERSGSLNLPTPITLDSPNGINSESLAAIVAFNEDEEFPAHCGDHVRGGSGRQSLQSVHTTGKIQAVSHPQPSNMSSAMLSPVPESTSPPLLNTPLKPSALFGDSGSMINNTSDLYDPLPGRIVAAMLVRIRNDLLLVFVWAVLGFAVHVSTVFTVPTLHSILPRLLTWIIIVCGFVLHYVWPQLRKPFPWLLFARSVCPPSMNGQVTGLEIAYHWCHWFERYFLVPAATMATTTKALVPLCEKFNPIVATLIILVTSMKLLRHGFSGGTRIFLNFYFAEVLFTCDFPGLSETFPLDYFFISIALAKAGRALLIIPNIMMTELWNKLSFVYIYIAPFQASWGSICHAVAQLASIPHFISTLGNCILSTLLSAPLEPFVASVFFITSYARPIRFWEATQKIHRIESTNTSLLSQLRGVSFEQVSANLNAIFYEHIARCLQQRLAGDIELGRWSGGAVCAGDIFILASEDLHFLLHVIEVGNGLVTFQMRGLEFVGTYCHEQESNGLSEPQLGDRDCCCCTLHHLPPTLLSPNGAVRLRWLAWQFVYAPYTIEAYRLIDHSAATSLQVIDFRKIVVSLFIQCLLYFAARLPNLSVRLQLLSPELHERFAGENTADLDPAFSRFFDEDFDETVSGVTRVAFLGVYAEWIRYCLSKCPQNMAVDSSDGSDFLTLCYAISLLGRRCLGGVSGYVNNGLETFLHYLHDVFKGDVQISIKDDWVFADVEILNLVVTPAMRVALKLYQDHFTWNPLSTNHELYHAIWSTTENVVICHETDPQWRSAVLNDAEKLFSFRRIDSGTTQQCFRFIMMNKQPLSFQVIKLNSECVRGFWAGQLREQIFLRNKNAERGSIQHAKHVLRNLINSSCDQPVGYPIYVSPLITSFAESHPQYRNISCPNLSIPGVIRSLWILQNRVKQYCKRSYHGRGSDNKLFDPTVLITVELRRLQTSKFAVRSCSFCPHESPYPQRNDQNVSSNLHTFWHFQQRQQGHHLFRMGHHRQHQHSLRESGTATSSLLAAGCGSELASWCSEVAANSGVATTTTSASPPLPPACTSLSAGIAAASSSVSSSTTAVVHQCDTSSRRAKKEN
ncbi:unnamed protein product [Rodentolepis nana]|uniref:Pecanex-like protein n=1 Tax=Rodentolepis nana TaxID=102285 RepID=A0A158QHD7_RODNA|nr:unnamed protein product [Rodentolepis nana]